MSLKKVTYFFVRSGELYQGITFLNYRWGVSENELIKMIAQQGIHVVGIKEQELVK